MTCEEVDDVLAAYALDALPDGEAARVREHLAGCPRHATAAAELRVTASRLAAAPDALAPPASLRARVLASVAVSEQDEATPASSKATAATGKIAARRDVRGEPRPGLADPKIVQLPRRVAVAWGALAAALLIAFIGVLAWNVVLQRRDDGDSVSRLATRVTAVAPLKASPDAVESKVNGVVVFYGDENKALLIAAGMQPLGDAARTYQLWEIDDAGPRAAGLLTPDADGHAVAAIPFASTSHTLAITIEPAGGSRQPTTPPILAAEI